MRRGHGCAERCRGTTAAAAARRRRRRRALVPTPATAGRLIAPADPALTRDDLGLAGGQGGGLCGGVRSVAGAAALLRGALGRLPAATCHCCER